MKKPDPAIDLEEVRAARELARSLETGEPADAEALAAVGLLRASGGDPSAEDLRNLGDSLFPPRRRRWPAAVAALVLLAGGAVLLSRGSAHGDMHDRAERMVASLQPAGTPAERAEAIARLARGSR